MVVNGQVPLSELNGYQARLNGMTGGQGRYTLALSHYEAVPPTVQAAAGRPVQAQGRRVSVWPVDLAQSERAAPLEAPRATPYLL